MPSKKNIIRNMHKNIQDLEHDIDMLASLVDWVTDIDRMTDEERTAALREWAAHCGPDAESLLYDAFGIEMEDKDKNDYLVFVEIPLQVALNVKAAHAGDARRIAEQKACSEEIVAIFDDLEDIAGVLNYDVAEAVHVASLSQ
jgi:hypothetical protein